MHHCNLSGTVIYKGIIGCYTATPMHYGNLSGTVIYKGQIDCHTMATGHRLCYQC